MSKKNDEDILSTALPTDPAQLKKLRNMLYEMSGLLANIKLNNGSIKDIAELIEADFGIPKKIAKKLGKTFHDGNFLDVSSENSIFEELYSRIVTPSEQGNGDDDDELPTYDDSIVEKLQSQEND